jgi:hypothetical protein
MPLFDSFVARTNCVVSIDVLKSHPNVKGIRLLPLDWILYEFYDEIHQDPDYLVEGLWEQKMQNHPILRQARIHMLNEERGLLAPWYNAKRNRGDADLIAISEICEYRIYSLTPLRFVDFDPSSGWGAGKIFTATFTIPETSYAGLSELIQEWKRSSQNQIRLLEDLSPVAGGGRLRAECVDYSGHWLVALWVLLCDVRSSPTVSKFAVSIEEGI